MSRRVLVLLGLSLVLNASPAWTQSEVGRSTVKAQSSRAEETTLSRWLMRLHDAARQRTYVGTFVVSAGDTMSSSRIWHVCDGQQQMERIDALSGVARTTFRHNDRVVTFLPERRVVISETRESFGLFPNLLNRADSSIAQFYRLQVLGRERVAGLASEVVQLVPVDALRFGYKVWTELESGVVVKLQTLDAAQGVLEQAAFSELQLGEPVSMDRLAALMDNTEGYQVHKPELVKTTAAQEGWLFNGQVAGFKPMACHKRVSAGQSEPAANIVQWVFSDGLASVSLFMESFDAARHSKMAAHEPMAMGATHMLTRRLGPWWITAVGEVPPKTLVIFAQGLERKK
ncbi:MucB/RseB C-terminal domain-containing protein [Rhodoferax sp.]|uniref:MucB/RseB C-terminal domain-containing protein n=1 Tax=Rhodoferax sp. TaxID=50421 RepID=UPI00271F4311|nr:MucB/RseB C-terminal domain-containing protein [Rhodoferax sp.]MDO8319860.1 MucB/RseB C-terminal domain-containing protein [Rhodoferax sp.]